ncbi:MAG TPA: carboxymuconolactone decarboxylase family protein [Streptosporangiaceae bacterium]|jgi:AhpD family alkylhydroperoxidase
MEARMPNPVALIPGALSSLQALSAAASKSGLAKSTIDLVHLRASQINGCGVCVQMHASDLRTSGQGDDRIFSVAAWRDAPYFTEEERAALELTEYATRLADTSDPVPAEVFDAAAKHFSQEQLASLVLQIAAINAWNRINVVTGQIAGAWG